MDPLSEEQIGQLLRLKKYEQPPPGYFEGFLHEFHRRQRDELLKEPVWRIALQRTQDFLFRLNIPGIASYPALATALVVCAAVISLKVYQTPETVNVAAQNRTPVVATTTARPDSDWSLANPLTTRDLGPSLVRSVKDSSKTHRVAAPPRYVLDSTPVSYEAAFRF
jgi:hypothetical protein